MNSVSYVRVGAGEPRIGMLLRYCFYALGALVFFAILVGIWSLRASVPKRVDAAPSFRLTASHLARLPVTHQVVSAGRFGRMELLHYGQLHDRSDDLTVAMVMTPVGTVLPRNGILELPNIRPLRNVRYTLTSVRYDLDTRFGPLRATEMRAESDGKWKLCLTFVSRFATESVSLAGWYCDASGAKPGADRLACTLDRLVLDRPLQSNDADAFFRERMSRSSSCSASAVAQTVDTGARTRSSPAKWSMPNARK
jgi:hypothetical protein